MTLISKGSFWRSESSATSNRKSAFQTGFNVFLQIWVLKVSISAKRTSTKASVSSVVRSMTGRFRAEFILTFNMQGIAVFEKLKARVSPRYGLPPHKIFGCYEGSEHVLMDLWADSIPFQPLMTLYFYILLPCRIMKNKIFIYRCFESLVACMCWSTFSAWSWLK